MREDEGAFCNFQVRKKEEEKNLIIGIFCSFSLLKLEKSVLGDQSCVWTFREEDRSGG